MSLPETLGRLRRVRRIGAGGFATVWLYRDDELDSFVAVKALAENWSQRMDVRQRFLAEARVLRAADSDHVVRVHDIGETDDEIPYFVMTYAERGTVADRLEAGPPSSEQAVDWVVQAAQGLNVLHRRGVIHRDVKPQNLLLTADPDGADRVLVADLGVAKALANASLLTQVVGTPAYMAPEQARPGGGLDQRADVHALGAVAYHLLTGRVPRDGGVHELLEGRPHTPPSHWAPLSPEVDEVIARALAPDPADRWTDPMSFAVALGEACAVPVDAGAWTPVEVRDVGVATHLSPSAHPEAEPLGTVAAAVRTPRYTIVLAAGLAVLAAVAGVLVALALRDEPTTATAGPGPTAPPVLEMALPDGWFPQVQTASRVEYRNPDIGNALYRLVRLDIGQPPDVVATAEEDRVSESQGYRLLSTTELQPGQLGGWTSGFGIEYAYGDPGSKRVAIDWYLSDGTDTTDARVFIATDRGEVRGRRTYLRDAAESLYNSR